MDGGANDEGWHHRYCGVCGTETEHARGGGCVACDNRAIRERARRDNNPRKVDRNWVLGNYEKKAGNLPEFLASLKRQNNRKALSAKQVAVGHKVLAKHIDESKGSIRNFFGRKKASSAKPDKKSTIKTGPHAKAEPAKKIKAHAAMDLS